MERLWPISRERETEMIDPNDAVNYILKKRAGICEG